MKKEMPPESQLQLSSIFSSDVCGIPTAKMTFDRNHTRQRIKSILIVMLLLCGHHPRK